MTDIMALLTLREVQEACPRTRPRSIYTKLAEVAAAVLWVDFSLFSHRFPTWKMHSTPGCTWKMQLMQKTPKNRSFEEIITSQSNRPTQIFWPWILPASPCIFLLIQDFLRPFLSVRVYSFQSRPSLIQMKWLKIYNVHAPQRFSI